MKKLVVLAPGHVTELTPLIKLATDANDNLIAVRKKQIEKRKKSGAPLSDETNYELLTKSLSDALAAAEKGHDDDVVEAMHAATGSMGSHISVPSPLDPEEVAEFEGVSLSLRTLSRTEFSDGLASAGYGLSMGEYGPAKEFLRKSIAEIRGIECEGGEMDMMDMVEELGLVELLLGIVNFFNSLTVEEKKRYGLRAP